MCLKEGEILKVEMAKKVSIGEIGTQALKDLWA